MAKVENLFKVEDLETVVNESKDNFLVTFGCPNYEERSVTCLMDIKNYAENKGVTQKMKYEILFLKNRNNNNLVLEELKLQYSSYLKTNIGESHDINWHKIDYPNNFNLRGLITRISRKLKIYSKERNISLHFDISAMPRGIIFGFCDAISHWLELREINIEKVYFSYTSPQKFSQLPYAQEIGLLRGSFSGEPITVEEKQDIRTVIFPSITGHESKLLLDELNQIAQEQKNAIFLQIDADDFLTSMEVMRANQILMEQSDSTQYYYCSLYDAINELTNYFNKEENERSSFSSDCKRLYLIAPFGSKIMLPVSYFILKKFKENDNEGMLDIEICHAQGFQYTSVYSIGVGENCTFSLDVDKWKQK